MPVEKGETIDVERTRGKVLRAATELFYRDGTSVGVNELAQRAGVSKLSIYRHFGSKDGLLDAVLRQRSDHVVAWLRDAAEVPGDPVERVLAVFDALRGWYAEQHFRGCAIVNAAAENPAPDGPARRVARDHLGRHLALLTALAADTDAPDAQLAGRQLLILLEGATVVAALAGDLDAATDARRLARTLLSPDGPSIRPGVGSTCRSPRRR
jgi:AcrR family transcriptional regulator